MTQKAVIWHGIFRPFKCGAEVGGCAKAATHSALAALPHIMVGKCFGFLFLTTDLSHVIVWQDYSGAINMQTNQFDTADFHIPFNRIY